MRRVIFYLLKPTFGSRRFKKFYEVLKNIAFMGLNYRNTDIKSNGERFFIELVNNYYQKRESRIIMFDIGANIGTYATQLNSLVKIGRVIYSFEPFSKAFSELQKLQNGIRDFYPFQIGFSDRKGHNKFFSSSSFSEVGGLYQKDFSQFGFSLDLSEEVYFNTVDDFCFENKILHLHFLKVDVEGHDFFVLKGAKQMLLDNKIDFLQFEFGAANYLSKTYLFDFFQLLSPNYRIYKLLRNGVIEFKEYNTDFEIHVLSNYVAINKRLDLSI